MTVEMTGIWGLISLSVSVVLVNLIGILLIRKAKDTRAQDITAWLLFADVVLLFLFIIWYNSQSSIR